MAAVQRQIPGGPLIGASGAYVRMLPGFGMVSNKGGGIVPPTAIQIPAGPLVNDDSNETDEYVRMAPGFGVVLDKDSAPPPEGIMLIIGNLAQVNRLRSVSVSDGTVVELELTSGIPAVIRLKKPGIPEDTPEWLRTMLEIIIGRRGNKIEIPPFQTLDFSATPTRAECEALYAYVNEIRVAVARILTRLDS